MLSTDEMFGINLQRRREKQGLSKTQFAAELSAAGMSQFHPTTISRVEAGERPVRLSEALTIARVLGLSLDELASDPLVGDEEVDHALTQVADVLAEKVTNSWVAYRRWLLQLERSADALERDLSIDGRIHPDNEQEVRQTLHDAREILGRNYIREMYLEELESQLHIKGGLPIVEDDGLWSDNALDS